MFKPKSVQPPQNQEDDASVDDDLAILNSMDIDSDFNVWSDFRSSFSIEKREALRRMSSRGSIGDSGRSGNTTGAVIEEMKLGASKLRSSGMVPITEIDITASTNSVVRGDSEALDNDGDDLHVAFSSLSVAEQKDIRAWNVRLAREQVFSRYYFPKQWELRENKTIEQDLMLKDPKASIGFSSEPGDELTRKAVSSIFYPGDMDEKSVLLKRGPILFNGADEMELLLFTHGIVFSRIQFDSLMSLLLAMNTEKKAVNLTAKQLQKRFDSIDSDGSGGE